MDNRNDFCVVFWLLVAFIPFIFMILNSLRKQLICFHREPSICRIRGIFENYPNIIANGIFGYFLRSVIVVRQYPDSMLMISAFAAYPLSRMKFRFRAVIYAGIVAMISIDACYADPDLQDDYERRTV